MILLSFRVILDSNLKEDEVVLIPTLVNSDTI